MRTTISWSATDVLASADRPVVYGSRGGAPPATSEWLTAEEGGVLTYVAASPWPRSFPFDEIGTWSARLEDAETALIEAAGVIVATPEIDSATALDAGAEYLDVFADGRGWSGEWAAQRTPDALADMVARLRAVIVTVRERPVRTLRASLVRSESQVVLRLENGGTETFPIQGLAVHAAAERERQTADRRTDDAPARLAATDPLDLEASIPDAVEPGQQVDLPLAGVPADARVEALVHVRFEQRSLRGGTYTADGWIWPHALEREGRR